MRAESVNNLSCRNLDTWVCLSRENPNDTAFRDDTDKRTDSGISSIFLEILDSHNLLFQFFAIWLIAPATASTLLLSLSGVFSSFFCSF